MENSSAIIVLLLLLLVVILAIGWLIYVYKVREVKNEFREYQQYHARVVALYCLATKRNRELAAGYTKMKHAVADCYFSPNGFSLQKVQEWYERYGINKMGWPSEDKELKEQTLGEFMKSDLNEKRYYTKRINEI
jgi:hypothetical protein